MAVMIAHPRVLAAVAALLLVAGCATNEPEPPEALRDIGMRGLGEPVAFGDLALSQGRYAEAAMRFQEALQRDPDDARARLGLAEAYLGLGAGREALAALDGLAAETATTPAVRQGRGIALLLTGDAELSHQALRQAVADDPQLWRAWNALGRYYDRERRWADAQASYERALATKPDAAIVRNNLGFSYLSQGRYDDAVAEFTTALTLNPELEAAQTNLRLALAFQGRYAEALAGVPPAELPRTLNNLGYVAVLLGEHDRAEAFFRRALEASPSFYEPAWKNLRYLVDLRGGELTR